MFLLQHLGIVINIQKCILQSVQETEFLVLQVNSQDIHFRKVQGMIKLYQEVLQSKSVTIWKLASLIGSLCSTAQAVLLVFLQVSYFQEQQIQIHVKMLLPNINTYELKFEFELKSELSYGRAIVQHFLQLNIQTDASKKGWGVFCQVVSVGGQRSKQESLMHINILEVKTMHLSLLIFTKMFSNKSFHVTKSSSAAGHTRRRLGSTSTSLYMRFDM